MEFSNQHRNKPVTVDNMGRLIHEVMEQLHWPTENAEEVAERIRLLELGLPAEDHFIALINWLGRCELIHKTRQELYPAEARSSVRVPDLFAVFKTPHGRRRVAIEVKTEAKNKISWRPDYINQLRQYGQAMGTRVLVACYWKKLNLWTLNDLDAFTLAQTNYHLDWKTALKDSLLGVLAGDFHITMKPGTGVHFSMRKLERSDDGTNSEKQEWLIQIEDVYVTNATGERLDHVDGSIWSLLLNFPLEEKTEVDDHLIHLSYVVSETTSIFVQQSLFSLKRDDAMRWSELLTSGATEPGADLVRSGVEKGFSNGMAQYLLNIIPNRMPSWLDEFSGEKRTPRQSQDPVAS